MRADRTSQDRLYERALRIRHERRVGLWLPIIRHLALRNHRDALIELADWHSGHNGDALGRASDWFSPAGLYRRAYRNGATRAAQHLAMGHFNGNDLAGYRRWLTRAARAGDAEATAALRWFATRLWHGAAYDIGRGRPRQKRDGF